jgi:hypothetical protein
MRVRAQAGLLGLSLAAAACSSPKPEAGASPELAWTRAFGTERDDFGRAIAADSDGSVYVTGYSEGAFEGAENAGSWDAFLVRLDGAGGVVWTREWGGDGEELAQAVVTDDAGHVYVAGYTSSSLAAEEAAGAHDAFLTVFDADGSQGATEQWGTNADEYVTAAARAPAGVVIVGYTKGAFDGFENQGRDDLFVTLCDFDGAPLWTRQLGSAETDYAQAVHVDSAGNVLVAGYTAGKLGDDDDLGAEDAFLVAFDAEGEQLFVRQWGSDTTDYGLGVASDAAGNAYVTGYAYGSIAGEPAIAGEDGYVTKFDATGARAWTRQFGTLSRDSARFVAVDAEGDVLVGGDTEGAFAKEALPGGKRDSFIVRFDVDGTETFRAQWGGSASELNLAGASGSSALYLAGYVEPSDGTRDLLLARWSF